MVKNTILKTMVALLMLWGATACTDDVLVEVEQPGMENITPEAGRITSLKNILPQGKPGYDGVEGRADASADWNGGDQLLLKVEIKSDESTVAYTAWMTLVCELVNEKDKVWNIKDDCYYAQKSGSTVVIGYNALPLVTPSQGIILSDDEADFDAIIPEEISTPSVQVQLVYAPDLEWAIVQEGEDNAVTSSIDLKRKAQTLTDTPEYWEVQANAQTAEASDSSVEYEWITTLARVCVKTGEAGDVVTLNSTSFEPLKGSSDGIYTATTGSDGIAYFYGTIGGTGQPVTDGFEIHLTKIKNGQEATEVFIPTTLFEANALTKVTLTAGLSYSLDGTAARTQALNDSKEAIITDGNEGKKTYTVSGVKGLLQWLQKVKSEPNNVFDLILEEDIVLPQYILNENGEYTDTPITDANGNVNGSNWIPIAKLKDANGLNSPYKGTISGGSTGKTISGLRIYNGDDKSPFTGFISYMGEGGKVENITFHDAQVISKSDVTGIVVAYNNGGEVINCTVTDGILQSKGSAGAIVGKNCSYGLIENCTNNRTSVTGTGGYAGGICGENASTRETNSPEADNNGSFVKNDYEGGYIKYCHNNGGVVSGDSPSTTGHTGGIVGINKINGYVIACMNSGTVSNTSPAATLGGIAGYNGHGFIIACGNVGNVNNTGSSIGGIVGTILDAGMYSYTATGSSSTPPSSKIYGCWTKDATEKTNSTEVKTGKDGFGTIVDNSIFGCELFSNSDVVEVDDLNNAIDNYNDGKPENAFCSWNWTTTPGPWLTLQEVLTFNPSSKI